MDPNWKNLVFEGGGVKGIAYAGALCVLEEAGILKEIKAVAGTSAGSIVATLVALQYDAETITKLIKDTNFKSFEDGRCIFRILSKYGLYKGDVFLRWIKARFAEKQINENATFQQLYDRTHIDLRVFATDLNLHNAQEFSVGTTPGTIVAEAVRASMSIPIFFRAWQFSNRIPNDHIFVDGGTVYNYPIDAFDHGDQPNTETLGFHLFNPGEFKKNDQLKYWQPENYVRDLFDTLLEAQVIDFNRNPVDKARTVNIDDFGISATNFNLSNADKQKLYNAGAEATAKFLNDHKIPISAKKCKEKFK